MSKTAKLISSVVAVVVVAALVTGIAYWSLGFEPGGTSPGLIVNGDKVDNPGVVLTVGSHEVDYNLYRYYYLSTRDYYISTDETYFEHDPDGSREEGLKQDIEDYLLTIYTWYEIADELGVSVSQEDLDEIDAQIQSAKDANGSQFDSYLAGLYFADEATFRTVLEQQALMSAASTAYYEQLEDESWDEFISEYITAKHILISGDSEHIYDEVTAFGETPSTPDDTGNEGEEGIDSDDNTADDNADDATGNDGATGEPDATADEDDPDAGTTDEENTDTDSDDANDATTTLELARLLSEAVREQIRANGDTDEVFEFYRLLYGEDTDGLEGDEGVGQTEHGYTFTDGMMVDEFWVGAKALQVGEISEPVESEFGYHIIMRLPLDEEDASLSYYYSYYVDDIASARLDEILESLTVTPGQYYDSIAPFTVE